MAGDSVPTEIRAFLVRRITSVAQLEALLLLHAAPRRAWTATEVARRLYVEQGDAAQLLRGLAGGGLAATEGDAYRYQPRDGEIRALVDRLAETYARSLVPVTRVIHEGDIACRNRPNAAFSRDRRASRRRE